MEPKWFYREEIKECLYGMLDEYYKNVCLHESTHRGGVIWTICDDCGMMWADDRGGFKEHENPEIVDRAEKLLDKLENK